MEISPKEYQQYVAERARKSPIVKDTALAFLIGGLICVLGQAVHNAWARIGLSEQDAGTATSCTLVALSALLTGLNLYNKLARYGGAGTLVPITGFANAVVSPAMDFKSEGMVTGMAAKMFTVAGPVIVYGTLASVVYGVILMLLRCTPPPGPPPFQGRGMVVDTFAAPPHKASGAASCLRRVNVQIFRYDSQRFQFGFRRGNLIFDFRFPVVGGLNALKVGIIVNQERNHTLRLLSLSLAAKKSRVFAVERNHDAPIGVHSGRIRVHAGKLLQGGMDDVALVGVHRLQRAAPAVLDHFRRLLAR